MASKKARKVYRDDIQIETDLFKLLPTGLKRNISIEKDQPNLIDVEHCHFYHSMNERNGQANTEAVPVGGHTHKITINWDKSVTIKKTLPNGKEMTYEGPEVICGPPVAKKRKKIQGRGWVNVDVPVKFKRDPDLGEDMVDDHTHEVAYIRSEIITKAGLAQKIEAQRKSVAAKVQHDQTLADANKNILDSQSKLDEAQKKVGDVTQDA